MRQDLEHLNVKDIDSLITACETMRGRSSAQAEWRKWRELEDRLRRIQRQKHQRMERAG
jgi:hypothetical protein